MISYERFASEFQRLCRRRRRRTQERRSYLRPSTLHVVHRIAIRRNEDIMRFRVNVRLERRCRARCYRSHTRIGYMISFILHRPSRRNDGTTTISHIVHINAAVVINHIENTHVVVEDVNIVRLYRRFRHQRIEYRHRHHIMQYQAMLNQLFEAVAAIIHGNSGVRNAIMAQFNG